MQLKNNHQVWASIVLLLVVLCPQGIAQEKDSVRYSYSVETVEDGVNELSRLDNMSHPIMRKSHVIKAGFPVLDVSLLYLSFEKKFKGRFSFQLETANRLFSYSDQEVLNRLDLGALVGAGLNEGINRFRHGFNSIHSQFLEYKWDTSHFTNLAFRYYYSNRAKQTDAAVGPYVALAFTDLLIVASSSEVLANIQPGLYWGAQYPIASRLLLDMRIGLIPPQFTENADTGRSRFDTRIIFSYVL